MIKKEQLIKPFFALFSRGIGLVLQFAMNIVLGRLLGAAGMGLYSLYTSWMMVLASIADMGMPNYALRTVSVLEGKGDKKQARRFTLRALFLLSISGVALVLIVTLFAEQASQILIPDTDAEMVLILAALAAVAFMLIRVLSESLKGIRQVNLALTLETALLPLGVLIVVGIMHVFNWDLKAQNFLVLHLVLLVVTTLMMLWMMMRFTRVSKASEAEQPELLSKSLFPFWGGGLLNMWFMNMPILLLPQFATAEDIGIFGVAYRLIALGTTILVTLASIFGPKFARAFANHDVAALRKGLRQSQLLSLLIYLPIFIALTFFAEPVLGLFGDEFIAGKEILWIMVAGQLINTATGLVGFLLNMMHKEKQEFYIQSGVTFLVFILILILGYSFSSIGVAIAYAIGIVVKNLTSLFFSLHYLKLMEKEEVPAI